MATDEFSRRRLLAAAAALTAVAGAGAAVAQPGPVYDYLTLNLAGERAAAAQRALADHLKAEARREIAAADGEIVGLFTPQLGWSGRQAALLLRWRQPSRRRDAVVEALKSSDLVSGAEHHQLAPTLRPAAGDLPKPGGIYVHRWFEVNAADVAEFVDLSGQGWRDFEQRFDTNIFGLFTAARSERDQAQGAARLLLLTRYASHGVWEASRDPTTEAMTIFARRQQLTRETWAASTLLAPL